MSTTETTKPAVDPNIVRLRNVRLSYPHLFAPHVRKNEDGSAGKSKYSADLILDKKEHAAVIVQIQALIQRVALDKFLKKVPMKHVCLHDGGEREDKIGYGEGTMFIVASNEDPPVLVDQQVIPLALPAGKGLLYGGAYVNCNVRLYAWGHPTGGKGVSADLRSVQFVRHGEAFGSRGPVDAEKEFEAVPEEDSFN